MSGEPAGAGELRMPLPELVRFVRAALAAAGLQDDASAAVAEAMLEADLSGADAHGVLRLPQYVAALQRGDVNPRPQLRVHASGPATAVVDGDNGMGHWVMRRATDEAITRAQATGIAWVGTRRSNHAGAGGVHVARAAAAGLVGIYSAVSGINHLAPSGAAVPLLGTNPLAIALPARDGAPVLIDIAMSVVSSGVVRAHALHGQTMPSGWMTERATGLPLHDASLAATGVMEAMGGHKGAGLALALGLLAGPLNGAAFGTELPDFAQPDSGFGVNTGQLMLVLDVARFMPLDTFIALVDRHLQSIEDAPRQPGTEGIRWPGRERQRRITERRTRGVPVTSALLAQLRQLADGLAIEPLAADRTPWPG